jgi:heme A synthase
MNNRFARYATFVLIVNIFVILWGGFVSASGAGDGCGEAWPLCAAAAERTATGVETFIELFHRATSGIALILVVVMFVRSRRWFEKGEPVRTGAFWSLIFMLGEAAIGALIVLFGLVAENEHVARAFTQPLHLINTYLLLAALLLTVYWARGGQRLSFTNRRWVMLFAVALGGVLLLSAFGTIASLASTIFPSQTFLEGLQKDLSADAHYLIRLRILHPIIATLMGGYLVWLIRDVRQRVPATDALGTAILIIFASQYALGALNAILLTPIAVQLLHLLLSDLLWLSLIWLAATMLVQPAPNSQRPLGEQRLGSLAMRERRSQ